MEESISWKRLKNFIQKKRKNYIIKRTKNFHGQLQPTGLVTPVRPLRRKKTKKKRKKVIKKLIETKLETKLERKLDIEQNKLRWKKLTRNEKWKRAKKEVAEKKFLLKKIRECSLKKFSGASKLLRYQISRSRNRRKKNKKRLPLLLGRGTHQFSSVLKANPRRLLKVGLQKLKSYLRPAAFRPKIGKINSFLSQRLGKLFIQKRKKKISAIAPARSRLLYKLRKKRLLRAKWRKRKALKVKRYLAKKKVIEARKNFNRKNFNRKGKNFRPKKITQKKRFVSKKKHMSTKKVVSKKKTANKIFRKVKKSPVFRKFFSEKKQNKDLQKNKNFFLRFVKWTGRWAKSNSNWKIKKRNYRYFRYLEKAPKGYKKWRIKWNRKKIKKAKKRNRKKRISFVQGKKKKKKRHQYRKKNRKRRSVMVRRRYRRKTKRFYVYRDLYTFVSSRRYYLQQKMGFSIYQKERKKVFEKNLWWFRTSFPKLILDKNPVCFRRAVIFRDRKNQKRKTGAPRKKKAKSHFFWQVKKRKKLFFPKKVPGFFVRSNKTTGKKQKQMARQEKPVIKKDIPAKSVYPANLLQKDRKNIKLSSFQNGKSTIRFFSSMPSTPATQFFVRKKKKYKKSRKILKKKKLKLQQKKKKGKLQRKKKKKSKVSSLKSRRPIKKLGRKNKQFRKKKPEIVYRNKSVFGRLRRKKKKGKSNSFLANRFSRKTFTNRPRGVRKRKGRRWRITHKNWNFRFPRWRYYRRNFWRYAKKEEKFKWIQAELLPGKKYRWINQVYRYRQPKKRKKNKWLNRLVSQNKSYSLRKRKGRLINRLMQYKLFSKLYGPFTSKQWIDKANQLQRVSPKTHTRKSKSLSWYDHRLDITVYRAGLAPSLKVAQVLVDRGYVFVNGYQTRTNNFRVNPWDLVSITPQVRLKKQFIWFWLVRNQFRRYTFKRKASQYKNMHGHRYTYPFGFRTRLLQEKDLPRRDRIQGTEFSRLLLWKGKPW